MSLKFKDGTKAEKAVAAGLYATNPSSDILVNLCKLVTVLQTKLVAINW